MKEIRTIRDQMQTIAGGMTAGAREYGIDNYVFW